MKGKFLGYLLSGINRLRRMADHSIFMESIDNIFVTRVIVKTDERVNSKCDISFYANRVTGPKFAFLIPFGDNLHVIRGNQDEPEE